MNFDFLGNVPSWLEFLFLIYVVLGSVCYMYLPVCYLLGRLVVILQWGLPLMIVFEGWLAFFPSVPNELPAIEEDSTL